MTRFGRVLVLGVLAASSVLHAHIFAANAPPALRQEQQASAAKAVALTPDEMEAFLLKARVVSMRSAGNGVTNSRRATLSDGVITHDAHIQVIDQAVPVFQAGKVTELNFKDSYRYNIAGYKVARLLHLDSVPMSVERHMEGKTAAVTWWVDDVQMDEKERVKRKLSAPDRDRSAKQIQIMRIFDELIQNRDRNQGNILWTADWKMWLIDHTRAFRTATTLTKPDQLMRIDRGFLDALRALTPDAVTQATAGVLTKLEMTSMLARRDRLVKHYEDRIARAGEQVVVFSFESAVNDR
jgi:hypothetical protein